MNMQTGFMTLADIPGTAIPIAGIGVAGVVTVFIIVFVAITKISQTASRERSRRDIAAYVAEGSITSEEGERLIAAGEGGKGCRG